MRVLQKSGLDIDDKKVLEIESKATKPLLMAQVCLKLNNHNIATTTSLTLNGGAFL
ncbi:anthranilate synthase component I [Helicobacter pylori]|nr:anthranilate synthase component I [Helicobacter pylori]